MGLKSLASNTEQLIPVFITNPFNLLIIQQCIDLKLCS